MPSRCLLRQLIPISNPRADSVELAEEKKAILRAFLYKRIAYYIGPTVEAEYKKIKINEKYQAHVSFCDILLLGGPWQLNSPSLKQRTQTLRSYHSGQKDCDILAESEEMGLDLLLTNDKNFLKHLGHVSKAITIVRPSQFWASLEVPQGTAPAWRPTDSNPLLQKTWWHW